MTRMSWLVAALAAATTLTGAAMAQPARNGNVWDGRAHQPTADVHGAERAAGVAPSAQQRGRENEALDGLGRHLTDKADRTPPPNAVMPSPPNRP